MPFPELTEVWAMGAPMSTPSLKESLNLWHGVSQAVDPFLETLTTDTLQMESHRREGVLISMGSLVLRQTYHYWYHISEIQAIRQMLDQNLP